MKQMLHRRNPYHRIALTILLGLTTVLHLVVAHGIDASVVLCFGDDGHIAFERAVLGVHQQLECHPDQTPGEGPELLDADGSESDCDCVDIVFSSHSMLLTGCAPAGLSALTLVDVTTLSFGAQQHTTRIAADFSRLNHGGLSPPLRALLTVHLLI